MTTDPPTPPTPAPSAECTDRPGRWCSADTACAVGVVVVATLFFLPGFVARPLSNTVSAKSALVARRMLEDGLPFVADNGVAEINKPPVFYWLIAGTSALAGRVTSWTVRLPNLLACIATALVVWCFARRLWDRWTGVVSAGLLVTMVQFRWLAQTARIDSVVTLSVTGAVFLYYGALTASSEGRSRASWLRAVGAHLFVTLGVAAKGPVTLAHVTLAVGAFVVLRRLMREGRLRDDLARLHLVTGLAILLAVNVPIYLGMDRASDGRFIGRFFLHENLARAGLPTSEGFRKQHGFFKYFGTLWIHAAPWSLFIPAAVGLMIALARRRRRADEALLPAAFGLSLLFLSCVSVKKWPYLVVVFPLVALMCGRLWTALLRGEDIAGRWTRRTVRVTAVIVMLLAAVLPVLGLWVIRPEVFPAWMQASDRSPGLLSLALGGWKVFGLAVGCALGLGVASAAVFQDRFRLALGLIAGVTVLGLLHHNLVVEPGMRDMISHGRFAADVNRRLDAGGELAAMPLTVCAGEPYELVFCLDRPLRVIRPPEAGAFLARVRRAGFDGPGTPAVVIFDGESFDTLSTTIHISTRLLSTGILESIDQPLVMTVVTLIPERDAEDAPTAGDTEK